LIELNETTGFIALLFQQDTLFSLFDNAFFTSIKKALSIKGFSLNVGLQN